MSEKITVLLVMRGFHNGGIEKVFENYYSHMNIEKFEIHVVTHLENLSEKKKKFEDMGCIIHELSPFKGHRLTRDNINEYKRLFNQYQFDVVHNNLPDNLLPLFFAKKHGVKRRILHAHNNYTEGYENKNYFVSRLYKAAFQLNASMATDLFGVSKEAGMSVFGKYVNKMIILPNAIEIKNYLFDERVRGEYRNKLGFADELVIGHIGRYETNQKNQEFVLAMFKKIHEIVENSRLLMIGGGKNLEKFEKMAIEIGIAEWTTFTGNVSNVNDYLQAMDVFVLPSRKEGLGIVAVEAQASGLFCFLSDKVPAEAKVTDNVEFLPIDSGNEALWVDSIRTHMYTKREDCSDLVAAAGYDVSVAAKKLELIYEDL